MIEHKVPIIVGGENDRTACPTCGMAVRVVRRRDGYADHYEARIIGEDVAQVLQPEKPEIAEKLRKIRAGKKTVALVGMASTSCSLAPFDDPEVEIWGLNEAHAFPWMQRATRWFQIHNSSSWKRYIAKRDVRGHFDWLKKNPWNIPIYMQYPNEIIPGSVGYPLHQVVDMAFPLFRRGDTKVKYFTSSFAYMMGIAMLEGFQRIEIYGFDMADDIEYVKQKACAEWWIGFAMGRGVEVYTPENCQILYSTLYGGNEQGAGW
jgi:hypothetical protein